MGYLREDLPLASGRKAREGGSRVTPQEEDTGAVLGLLYSQGT